MTHRYRPRWLAWVSLEGTLRDPLALQGAELCLVLRGPDMALPGKLTGVPIPRTPNYEVAGRLDHVGGRFRETAGRVGQTDIDGTLNLGTTGPGNDVEGMVHSRRALARNEASARMLPDEPINLPKLHSTDIRISYHADSATRCSKATTRP